MCAHNSAAALHGLDAVRWAELRRAIRPGVRALDRLAHTHGKRVTKQSQQYEQAGILAFDHTHTQTLAHTHTLNA